MKQRKGESPIKLWMEFVGMQILFGAGLLVALGLVFWATGL